MQPTSILGPSHLRALVVEPDQAVRQHLSQVLREHGLDVMDCADVQQGRELYAGQRLVVAPLNGDNAAMKEFVAWVRAEVEVALFRRDCQGFPGCQASRRTTQASNQGP